MMAIEGLGVEERPLTTLERLDAEYEEWRAHPFTIRFMQHTAARLILSRSEMNDMSLSNDRLRIVQGRTSTWEEIQTEPESLFHSLESYYRQRQAEYDDRHKEDGQADESNRESGSDDDDD